MVRSLVALVHVPVDLVQTHSPQGGLQSVVSRQVVVGPVFVKGVRNKQVCKSHVVRGLEVGLVVSGRKEGAGYIAPHVAPGAQQLGLMLGYIYLKERINVLTRVLIYCMEERMDELKKLLLSVLF